MGRMSQGRIQIAIASEADRETIYRMRHEVYAVELGQHAAHAQARLTDACDGNNVYLVAHVGTRIAGFVSLTLPGARYSVDKYLSRETLPFPVTDALYEARLLTVRGGDRGSRIAGLLAYAAFRMIEERGGTRVMAIGRQALKPLYRKIGLRFLGIPIQSGAVAYELMSESVDVLRARLEPRMSFFRRLRRGIEWDLPFPFEIEKACAHGGAFFEAVGDTFETLERRHCIVNADVLDAWFPPAPGVLSALRNHLPWLLQTSPPADGAGLIQTIASVRGVPPECLALGAGSSALIYLALRHWLSPGSRVLLPDPTYGEYAHVLERVIGCRTDRLALSSADDYCLDLGRLRARLRRAADHHDAYNLVVLVNPNNPTGQHLSRLDLEDLLTGVPPETRVWVDEAYGDYVGRGASLEAFAARSPNVVVCKSLSKGYALSGVRAAYLCGPPPLMGELRFLSPPWGVSLPAQVAAVAALRDLAYYGRRYEETAALRDELTAQLRQAVPAVTVHTGPVNWVLCRLPFPGPDAATVVARCRARNVFLRDAASISPRLGAHTLRAAVKDSEGNRRIVAALASALAEP